MAILLQKKSVLLRVHLEKGNGKFKEACDIMVDQIRAIDNKRLVKKIGKISTQKQEFLKDSEILTLIS